MRIFRFFVMVAACGALLRAPGYAGPADPALAREKETPKPAIAQPRASGPAVAPVKGPPPNKAALVLRPIYQQSANASLGGPPPLARPHSPNQPAVGGSMLSPAKGAAAISGTGMKRKY